MLKLQVFILLNPEIPNVIFYLTPKLSQTGYEDTHCCNVCTGNILSRVIVTQLNGMTIKWYDICTNIYDSYILV